MANLLDRTIAQFDTLVPYLGLAHKEVFGLLNKEKALCFDEAQQAAFLEGRRRALADFPSWKVRRHAELVELLTL